MNGVERAVTQICERASITVPAESAMSQRSRDLKFTSDDQASKTMILDMGDGTDTSLPPDSEATVVLDLSPPQVDRMLSEGAPKQPRKTP